MLEILPIAALFFAIAILYSSVGLGGGSSYIAILLLMGITVHEVRFVALVCNIIVVSGAAINYFRAGVLDLRKMLPLVILSVPMAFLGGLIHIDATVLKIIIGSSLLAIAVLMLFTLKKVPKQERDIDLVPLSAIGGSIGFLSGMIGIGGGIILVPILYLIRWEEGKVISAAATFFILINSIAGLIGQSFTRPSINVNMILLLGGVVLVGGQIGNRLNLHFLKPQPLKLLSALLIGFVGARLLWSELG